MSVKILKTRFIVEKVFCFLIVHRTLLLRHWYEIIALYYIKSILTEFSAPRQGSVKKQNHQHLEKQYIVIIRNMCTAPYLVYFWLHS